MAATGLRVFVSSVQKEMQEERRAVKDFLLHDPLLRRFCDDIFLFEDIPASDRRSDEVYLEEVDRCDIYIGLFGEQYGYENKEGVSPTEREFDRATERGKTRLIFIKGSGDEQRHPKMRKLVRKAGSQVVRRRFVDITDLTAALYASFVQHLERRGSLRTAPFDSAVCPRATLEIGRAHV